MRDVLVGAGEVGKPLSELLQNIINLTIYDIDTNKCKGITEQEPTSILHICISYNDDFINNVKLYTAEYKPKITIIHSTIPPNTTHTIQKEIPNTPVIYSPVRGKHGRMKEDLLKYTKYYASYNDSILINIYKQRLEQMGIKSDTYTNPLTLEYAKILIDTTYQAWLITFAQYTNEICKENNLEYNELWQYADEGHRYLGIRPKMQPGYIGGHCLIPNLKLLNNDKFNWIIEHNEDYKTTIEGE
jgi:hypothetical protein